MSEDTGRGKGRAVVTVLVQASAAGADARSARKGEREASEQQDAEVRRWDDDWRGRGERREDTGHMRSCLREQQRTRRRIEVRKVRLAGALITSSALPPTQGCGAAAAEVSPPKWSGEACPPDLGGG